LHNNNDNVDNIAYNLLCEISFAKEYMVNSFGHYWVHVVSPVVRKFKTVFDRMKFDKTREAIYLQEYEFQFIGYGNSSDFQSRETIVRFFKNFWNDCASELRLTMDTVDNLIFLNQDFIERRVRTFQASSKLEFDDLFQETFLHLRSTFINFDEKKCSLLGYWSTTINRFLMNITSKKSNKQSASLDPILDSFEDPNDLLDSLIQIENKTLVDELFEKMTSDDIFILERLFGLNGHRRHTIVDLAKSVGKKPNNVRRYDIPKAFKHARQQLNLLHVV